MDIQIAPYFTKEEINQLAIESGFQKRCSGKIDGAVFLDLIVFNRESLKNQSLNGLSIALLQQHEIDIKKQSLHERFNTYAVVFLKSVLEKVLAKQLNTEEILRNINGFTRILIKDSTCFQVSDNLEEQFPGCGGTGSKASVRIQFEFDILSGAISDLTLTTHNVQDATDSITTAECINAGELIIRDLGYMHTEFIRKIIEQCAFFGSRLHPSCVVYEIKNDKLIKIDFSELRRFMNETGIHLLEKNVMIDKKNFISLRLIVAMLPDDIVAERIRRITEKQKRKGRSKLSKEYTARCFFNLFLTNADNEQIPKQAMDAIYKFRWCVELIFKTWKSTWGINQIKKVNVFRLQSYIYAKLIAIVVCWNFIWNLIHETNKMGGFIPSIDKLNKLLYVNIKNVREIFMGRTKCIKRFIRLICIKINELKLEQHGNRKPHFEQITLWGEGC